MEFSDDDSFAWTTASSNSSEESDIVVGTMARGEGHKNKSRKHESSMSCDDTRDSVERETKRARKSMIKEEPPEEKADIKRIRIKKESDSHESEQDLEAEVKRERETHYHAHPPAADDQHTEDDALASEHQHLEQSTSHTKKSKKKKRHSSPVTSDINSDNKETQYDQTNGDLSLSEEITIENSIKSKRKFKFRDQNESIEADSMSVEENNHINNDSDLDKSTQKLKREKSKHNQDVRKISDRIRFEDEEDHIESSDNDATPPQLRRFLQRNSELSYTTLHGEMLITKDDDLFLLKCPQEVDISLLQYKDLLLEQKCKMKVHGHSYEGSLDEQSCRIALLSVGHNKPHVVNLPLKGVINFRKRIPKAHYVQDSVMANNQTNFIPLPDTKCRHPLFGADFKKAIKISSSVKALLNTKVEPESLIKSEKKKKKKSKKESLSPTEEGEPEPHRHRKRKQPHGDDGQHSLTKSKKIKLDPDSPVAWESEKAIEKNLFDF